MSLSDPKEARLDPALAALASGSQVGDGRFTLLRLLGQGGMGVVWLARDEHLREEVALKFLPPNIRHDAVALDDLRRETSRSRKLTHPHIIRIHDFYRTEAFISMEFVDGPNLSELRLEKPDRVLPWSFLEPLVKQLCEALNYAHRENIIHRDLKPANMMLDGRGRLKLADFGIAATVSDSVSRVSMARHGWSGTVNYMSPQQLNGQLPQVTDDVYSLGSTLYELLTSRAPFFTGDIAHQVRSMMPQPVEKRLAQMRINNPVPPAVDATIMACLAKDPEQRPRSAQAVAEQLGLKPTPPIPEAPPTPAAPAAAPQVASVEVAQNPGSNQAEVPPSKPQPSPAPPTPRRAESARPPSRRTKRGRKRRWPVAVAIAAVIALLAIAGGWWWRWSQSRAQGAQAVNAAPVKPVPPPEPQFISLFNGQDFSGWEGDPQVWSVKQGTITATGGTTRERRPRALFWRGGTVEDFELQLSFRIHSGNSGVYYRAKQLLEYEVGGYQYEITGAGTGALLESGFDRTRRDPSRLGFVTTTSVVNGRDKITVDGPTSSDTNAVRKAFRQGAWNDVVIIAQGNRVIHKLNGQTIIDATDHNESRPRSGTVALEVYGASPTSIQFRDIRLKHLPPARP